MADLLSFGHYPGVRGLADFAYTVSHGAAPGIIMIKTNPQPNPPAPFGNFTISDGRRKFTLFHCRMSSIEMVNDPQGKYYFAGFEDERWMWRYITVSAAFNQTEPDGKLVPWTIASPKEICEYLLARLGVTRYKLIVPPGLPRRVGAQMTDYLRPGQKLPNTRTNPPCRWDNILAIQALQEFAERLGCRVIYQPIKRMVLIAPLGGSWMAPKATAMQESTGFAQTSVPSKVVVLGRDTLHQSIVMVEPVGEEYDRNGYGNFCSHIDQLTYAPEIAVKVQVITATSTHPNIAFHKCDFQFPEIKLDEKTNSNFVSLFGNSLTDLMSRIQSDPLVKKHVALVERVDSKTIRLTLQPGKRMNATFFLSGPGVPNNARFEGRTTQTPGDKKRSWLYCPPPTFPTVLATDRFSKDEAMRVAAKCIWKYFRWVNVSPNQRAALRAARAESDPKKWPKMDRLTIPGYGKIVKRQDVILTKEMVERTTPQPRLFGGIQPGNTFAAAAGTILPDFYDGRSMGKTAQMRGQYANLGKGVLWTASSLDDEVKKQKQRGMVNTKTNTRVYIGWDIDVDRQLIIFSDYVYRLVPAGSSMGYDDPELIYEGGVIVNDPLTNVPVRWSYTRPVPGGIAAPMVRSFPDVVVSHIGQYDAQYKLLRHKTTDFGDGYIRARDYAEGMLRSFQLGVSGRKNYLGFYPVDPDGVAQQITWRGGTTIPPTTIISLNSETSDIIPPWGARQLAEALPPPALNKLLNAAENPSGLYGALKEAARNNLPFGLGKLIG